MNSQKKNNWEEKPGVTLRQICLCATGQDGQIRES